MLSFEEECLLPTTRLSPQRHKMDSADLGGEGKMCEPAVKCSECELAEEKENTFGRCACGAAFCSIKCHKTGWTEHKKVCPPVLPRPIEGKDIGMVATRKAKEGDLLVSEQPIFVLKEVYKKEGKQRFLDTFSQLPVAKRKELLSLYDPGVNPRVPCAEIVGDEEAEKAWRILYSNGINVGPDTEQLHAVYATLSRINHSCRANTFQRCSNQSKTVSFFASKEIMKNEEISLNYLGSSSILLTREERQAQLTKGWFFKCTCQVCSLQGDQLELNDNIRRTLAKAKDRILYVTNSTLMDYTSGKEKAVEAVEEEKKKIAMMGFVAKEVVAALGPTCIPMLQEEIANIYYTFKHNMSDISYYL